MAGFGLLLRHWREARGLSQQVLAEHANMSKRHLSFLETERCGPSEGAVTSLARVLDLPEREGERLRYAAGFSSDWNRSASEVTPKQLARVAALLGASDPYPAFLTNRRWQIIANNQGGAAFLARCLDLNPKVQSSPFDIAEIVADSGSMGRMISNVPEIRDEIISGLFALEPNPADAGTTEYLYERVAKDGSPMPPDTLDPVGPEHPGAWQVDAHFEDRGASFTLELLAMPFGGPCAGYGLLLTEPIDEANADQADAYFASLIADPKIGLR